METLDKDLKSIQEVRTLIKQAREAQEKLATMSQDQIDTIVKAIADAGYKHREKLARMAAEETGFGCWEDKVIKNAFASRHVYDSIKELKTVGVLREDTVNRVWEVGVPVGVIAALVPSTNPTSTVIYKALIAVKAGNSIIFSPHPSAVKCILETIQIIQAAAKAVGCPDGAICGITVPTLQATDQLMKHEHTALILATGGTPMVKAAYSSGTPAIGVGPGNGPAFIEKSADFRLAVKRIIDSKTFDHGTICASEQSIVIEKPSKDAVEAELKKQGAYFLSQEEAARLAAIIMRSNGSMNPQIVGKSAAHLAQLAKLSIPPETRVLIAYETRVGHHVPYSREKLAPILAFYVEEDWKAAAERCSAILHGEGAGHTMTVHSENEEIIRYFGLHMPVSRLLVNTPGTLGGIGASTGIAPALTLGCGAVGGSSTSDNISPLNLLNIRRVAFGTRELEDLKEGGIKREECSSGLGAAERERLIGEIMKRVLEKL